jgi:hypothetical protein
MARSSGTTMINDTRSLFGYGDTRELAHNDLLDKLKAHEEDIKCGGTCSNAKEVCRPFLNPPDSVKFRVYWRRSTGKIRWKCMWGPGLLEFECGCRAKSDD